MINFSEEILFGRLVKRYKRFLMDVTLDSGETIVAHSPNTGSMLGLLEPGGMVMLTKSSDPKRKTAYSAQAIKVGDDFVGINTHLPNKLIKVSLDHQALCALAPSHRVRAEVAYGPDLRSRIDLLFDEHAQGQPPFYLEIKSVTLKIGDGAQFPDAPSTRAQKHIDDLMFMKRAGSHAGLIFVVQRQDCQFFAPAQHIDERYARLLKKARSDGLVIQAICAKIDQRGIKLTHEIPCIF